MSNCAPYNPYDTAPLLADTDGDGLDDCEEVFSRVIVRRALVPYLGRSGGFPSFARYGLTAEKIPFGRGRPFGGGSFDLGICLKAQRGVTP